MRNAPPMMLPAALALVCALLFAALLAPRPRAAVVGAAPAAAQPPIPADTLGLEGGFLARMTPDDVARGAAALCRLPPGDPLAPTPEQRAALAERAAAGARARAALGEARMEARATQGALLGRWAALAELLGPERLAAMGRP